MGTVSTVGTDSTNGFQAELRRYVVIQGHESEYPEPIAFLKGAPLTVGEKYQGPEGWDDWYFCTIPERLGQPGGWVPAQLIEDIDGAARAREDYTARELNVREGESLMGSRRLNGWAWCERAEDGEAGWVPLANLREVE